VKRERLLVLVGSLCLVFILAGLLLTTACAEPAPAPAPAPAPSPEPAPAPAPAPEPVKLIFANTAPETGIEGDTYRWWLDELDKRTGGAVTIEVHWASSLAVMPEMLETVQKGVADLGQLVPPFFGTVFPLHGNLDGMYVFNDKPLARMMANEALDKEVPEAAAEWGNAGLVRLFSYSLGNYHVSCMKPVRSLADFEGLKLRATGPMNPVIVEAVGAAPVGITSAEMYDALLKGTVDGGVTDADMMIRFKEYEVAKYLIRLNIGANPMLTTAMNMEAWNKLSPEVQQVFLELRDEFPPVYTEGFDKRMKEETFVVLQDAGVEVIDLPAADMETLKNLPDIVAIQEGWVDWILEKKPELSRERAEEIRQLYLTRLEEFGKLYPDTLEP
jgi:TRAP-type C4-dicarboxylate transport system substrate-binding protein